MLYEFDGMAPKVDPSAYIADSATVLGDVTIGADCYIGPGAVIRADFPGSPIIIGYGTAVEEGVIIHVGGKGAGKCDIGERVTIGHGAIIHCSKLENNANVGMGAVVSLYSEIGEYSIVAEGTVVKQWQIVPPRVVVAGAPAKVVRELQDRDIKTWDGSKAWYIELAKKYKIPGMIRRLD